MQEKDWLQNNRYYRELDESKLKSVFYFSLIWNLYEKELCAKNGKIGEHPENHSQTFAEKVDQNQLVRIFDYFKQRYVLDEQPTNHFNAFEFKSEPIKNYVFGYLSSANPSNKQMLSVLLCIAFRLRNNLFHGVKDVEKLYEQNENFRQINLLLMNLIDTEKQVSRNLALNELTTVSQELGMGY